MWLVKNASERGAALFACTFSLATSACELQKLQGLHETISESNRQCAKASDKDCGLTQLKLQSCALQVTSGTSMAPKLGWNTVRSKDTTMPRRFFKLFPDFKLHSESKAHRATHSN